MAMTETKGMATGLTAQQQLLNDLWEEHLSDEFATRDTNATVDTMMPDAYVNHVPVMTGGVGREQLRDFYSKHFIPKMPPDTQIEPISRTIGTDRLVDEMIFRFTHLLGSSLGARATRPSRCREAARRGRGNCEKGVGSRPSFEPVDSKSPRRLAFRNEPRSDLNLSSPLTHQDFFAEKRRRT
jgi:hypothetical protein